MNAPNPSISPTCTTCTYGRRSDHVCDITGAPLKDSHVCRAYRKPGQSHSEARSRYPLLANLRPGVVYSIRTSKTGSDHTISASFKLEPVIRQEPASEVGDILFKSYPVKVRNIDGSESDGRFDCYESGLIILATKEFPISNEKLPCYLH